MKPTNDVDTVQKDRRLSDRRLSDRGATLVEYALLVSLLAVALLSAVSSMSGNVANAFNKSGEAMNAGDAVDPAPPPD